MADATAEFEGLRSYWASQAVDLSPLTVRLLGARVASDHGRLPWGGAIAPDSSPERADLGHLPNYRTHRHRRYGQREGMGVGYDTHFPFGVMDVDHIVQRSCGRTMAEWRAAP